MNHHAQTNNFVELGQPVAHGDLTGVGGLRWEVVSSWCAGATSPPSPLSLRGEGEVEREELSASDSQEGRLVFADGYFQMNTSWPCPHHVGIKQADAGRECRGRSSPSRQGRLGRVAAGLATAGGLGVSPKPFPQGVGAEHRDSAAQQTRASSSRAAIFGR